MEAILLRYRALMIRTRILSVLAAAWILAFSLKEVVLTVMHALSVEDLSWDALRVLPIEILITLTFVSRLITLKRMDRDRDSSVASSGLACLVFSWIYFREVFPPCNCVYSLIEPDSLATWSLVYVLLGLFRFLVTAGIALTGRLDENDSYS